MREPLRDDPQVVFATLAFRWFNYIATGEILKANGWLTEWDEAAVVAELSRRREAGEKIFTSAYIINARAGELKVENICARITNVWNRRKHLGLLARLWLRMGEAHRDLLRYDGLGHFMAYEAVCDLRHTFALEHATDILKWSNPGPGATRGLMRVLGREIKDKRNDRKPPTPKDWEAQTARLLAQLNERFPDMPTFEMREVEGSLCEVDKWIRVLRDDGHSKRRYDGGGHVAPRPAAAKPDEWEKWAAVLGFPARGPEKSAA